MATGRQGAVAVRVLISLAALAGASYHLAWGAAALPVWMGNVAARIGAGPEAAMRALVAFELLVAATAPLRRPVGPLAAAVGMVGLAFSGLAEVSAILRAGASAPAMVPPGVAIAAGATGIIALSRTGAPSGITGAASPRARGGTAAFVAVAMVAAVALAGRLPMGGAAPSAGGLGKATFDPTGWEGRRLPDTGLPRHLPQLTPMTLEGRHVVVFYNPECSECRDLMGSRFAAGPDGAGHPEVIAVLTPPEAGAVISAGDEAGPVTCAGCTSLSLPSGPAWFARTPVVLVIEDGVVRCASVGDASRCLP